jgi:hypothetical protein
VCTENLICIDYLTETPDLIADRGSTAGLFMLTADRCDCGIARNAERREMCTDGVGDVAGREVDGICFGRADGGQVD